MGCAGSKREEEDGVVELCRERKRLLKLAVRRRYTFADTHCKYNQSLCAVAAAIRLFVARHSSPSSPFLITFPSSELTHGVAFKPSGSAISVHSPRKEGGKEEKQNPEAKEEEDDCEESEVEEVEAFVHFHGAAAPPPPPPPPPLAPPLQRDLAWDFFNPFVDGLRTEEVNGFGQTQRCDKDLGVIADGEKMVENVNNGNVGGHKGSGVEAEKKIAVEGANVSQDQEEGLKVIDTPTNGRELLEALKDVEDYFVRAYDSGLDVSRMLESNRVKMQSGFEEIKESSNKLIQSVTRSRSTLSRSSSSRSLLTRSTSRSSSTWTDLKNDIFDEYGGMESGCHSLTLERLYAWEKKLYAEVKAGEETRKIYERKCLKLSYRDAKGDGLCLVGKTRVDVKDLYTRILVAVQCAESIAKRIQQLRDEELQPQLVELLHGLMRSWKTMLQSHEIQTRIMVEVKSFNCPAYGNFRNDSHRLATLQLEAELQNWRACFASYVSAQRAYIEALDGWLSKFITPEVEFYSRGRSSIPPQRINGPPLLVVCRGWLNSCEKLPDEGVTYAMKSFGKDVRALWVQQGEEQYQKRKADGLEKELNKRVLAFQRAEKRALESKISEQKSELDAHHRVGHLTEMKDQLDMFKKRLEAEKRKHHAIMQETQHITVNGFQTGFSSVFESLADFSSASVRMYADLITRFENAKAANDKVSNPSFME